MMTISRKRGKKMYKQFTALQLTDWFRVANYKHRKFDASVGYLTGSKASCLLYYVQGCMLGAYHQKAFKENIEAWDAPVVKSVFSKYGLDRVIPIHKYNKQAFINYKNINKTYPMNRIVRAMDMKLGNWTAVRLEDETKAEYPYHHARYMLNHIISPQSITYFFKRAIIVQ